MTTDDFNHAAIISLLVEGTLALGIFVLCIGWWVALP